jgi:adenosylcobinamide-GDP ribazoletransferase
VPLACFLPYARPDGGVGGVLSGRVSIGTGVAAAALAAAPALALLGWQGAGMVAAAAVVSLGLGLGYRRWLGGVTGDALGAAIEIAETIALLAAVALA